MDNEIKVTVLCTVYNHEKYLRRCLEGFLMQKTDFAYEVLVHDDASTDESALIIKEFEMKYPDIIKPIYQKENQYSQGISITKEYQIPRIKGKYVAICEGDDYWTDECKLQKQYDFMKSNPEYSMCAHCAELYSVSDGTTVILPEIIDDRDYTIEEMIEAGGGLLMTSSFFVKTKIITSLPDCFKADGFNDYQIVIYSAVCGKIRCLKDVMSVYNSGVEGSWTSRNLCDVKGRVAHYQEVIRMLKCVDRYYDFKYHNPIENRINEYIFSIYMLEKNYKMILAKEYKRFFRKISFKGRTHLVLLALLPHTTRLIDKLRGKNE